MVKIQRYFDRKARKPYIAVIPKGLKRKAHVIYAYTAEQRELFIRQYFFK